MPTLTNMSTATSGAKLRTVALNTPIIAFANKPLTYNLGMATSEGNTELRDTVADNLLYAITAVNTTTILNDEMVRGVSADVFMMASLEITSSSINKLKYVNLPTSITHISIVIIIACLY